MPADDAQAGEPARALHLARHAPRVNGLPRRGTRYRAKMSSLAMIEDRVLSRRAPGRYTGANAASVGAVALPGSTIAGATGAGSAAGVAGAAVSGELAGVLGVVDLLDSHTVDTPIGIAQVGGQLSQRRLGPAVDIGARGSEPSRLQRAGQRFRPFSRGKMER